MAVSSGAAVPTTAPSGATVSHGAATFLPAVLAFSHVPSRFLAFLPLGLGFFGGYLPLFLCFFFRFFFSSRFSLFFSVLLSGLSLFGFSFFFPPPLLLSVLGLYL